jgi:beta-lactamase class A
MSDLEAGLRERLRAAGGTWGLSARNLRTGEMVCVDGDRWLYPASSVKLVILVMAADLVARGVLGAGHRIRFDDRDSVAGTGVLRFMQTGEVTLGDAAMLMTALSDNVATNLVLEAVGGPAAVAGWCDGVGVSGVEISGPIDFASGGEFARATAAGLRCVVDLLSDADSPLSHDAGVWAKQRLFRQTTTHFLTRWLPHSALAWDFGLELPLRAYTKYGAVPGVAADVGLFEYHPAGSAGSAGWSIAVIGNDTSDLASGPDDPGPQLIAEVGRTIHDRWGPE